MAVCGDAKDTCMYNLDQCTSYCAEHCPLWIHKLVNHPPRLARIWYHYGKADEWKGAQKSTRFTMIVVKIHDKAPFYFDVPPYKSKLKGSWFSKKDTNKNGRIKISRKEVAEQMCEWFNAFKKPSIQVELVVPVGTLPVKSKITLKRIEFPDQEEHHYIGSNADYFVERDRIVWSTTDHNPFEREKTPKTKMIGEYEPFVREDTEKDLEEDSNQQYRRMLQRKPRVNKKNNKKPKDGILIEKNKRKKRKQNKEKEEEEDEDEEEEKEEEQVEMEETESDEDDDEKQDLENLEDLEDGEEDGIKREDQKKATEALMMISNHIHLGDELKRMNRTGMAGLIRKVASKNDIINFLVGLYPQLSPNKQEEFDTLLHTYSTKGYL